MKAVNSSFVWLTCVLVHTLLRLVHGRVGIRAVVLSRGVLRGAHVIGVGRAVGGVGGVRQRLVGGVVVDCAVARVHRVVAVVAATLQHHHAGVVGGGHLHLPQRVLRVDTAAVVAVRVALVHVAGIDPCLTSHGYNMRTTGK